MEALISAGAIALLDAVADGITIQDTSRRLVYANPAAARIIGFDSPAELIATAADEILQHLEILNEDGSRVSLEWLPGRAALAGKAEPERVLQLRVRGSQESRWVMLKAQPVYNPDGSVRLAVSIWHDVTEPMERQAALEEATSQLEETATELEATISELELRTEEAETRAERHKFLSEAGRMLASSFDAHDTLRMVIHLAVPTIAHWAEIRLLHDDGSLRRLEIANSDPARLLRTSDLDQYPDDPESDPAYEVLRSGIARLYREVPQQLPPEVAAREPHPRLLQRLGVHSAIIVPMKARDETLGIITFARIRGERLYDEEDLEFAESFAARACLALSNARLYREAQEANRTKSDFLAIMSHELRTPLTAIFGYTELLATGVAGDMNETQQAHLDRIHASASQLLTIIEDILAYARTEAGRDEVRPDHFRLSEVISEALLVVRPNAEKKGLLLEADVVEDAPLQTDRAKLRQIVINLLGNAIKFTDSGRVSVRATTGNDDMCRIVVEDTGIGIDPAQFDRIFEPFRQVEPSMTRKAGGTGLGLSVSRRFATLLGGSLTVDSAPGEGSRFTLALPVAASR